MGASAIPIIGGGLSLLGASQAAGAQRRALAPQRAIGQQQLALFRQAAPQYAGILQFLSGQAGLPYQQTAQATRAGVPGFLGAGATGPAPVAAAPEGLGGIGNQALGIYGQNPADVYRFRQAQDEIDRQNQAGQSQLSFALGRQGAGSATTSAALAQAEQGRLTRLEEFRRGLAINAQQEQERRVGALLAALGVGMGQGNAAAGIFGGQANLAAGQGAAAGGALGDFLQSWLLYQALRRAQGGTEQTPNIIGPYSRPGSSPWSGGNHWGL